MEGSGASFLIQDQPTAIGFSVQGEYQIITDRLVTQAWVGPVAASGNPEMSPTEPRSGLAHLELDSRGDAWILHADTFTARSPEGEWSAENGARSWELRYHAAAPQQTIDLGNLVGYGTDALQDFSVHGNFSIVLSSGTFRVNGEEFWAGQRNHEVVAGTPAGTQEAQVLHIFVTGSLSLQSGSPAVDAFVSQTSVSGLGPLIFSDVAEAGGAGLGTLESQGAWGVELLRSQSLQATNFEADNVSINGVAVATGMSPWWWLTLTPLLLLARPPAKLSIKRLERNLERGAYRKVGSMSVRRLLRTKYASRASLYRTTALLAMGLFQEASLFLASISSKERPDPATYEFLLAHALAGIGSEAAAEKHLARCIELAPSYALEAAHIPMLQRLLPDSSNVDCV
ncbi:MAG: hypothetical protein ACPHK8_04305 [Thermoplasmatota archaeon]